jgi:hypothetical protein
MTQLQAKRCKLAEHVYRQWRVVTEPGQPIEAALNPAYWAHVSQHFAIGDKIELLAEDGQYFAELLVQDKGKMFAKVALLRKVDLIAVAIGQSQEVEGFIVDWKGPQRKFAVIRLADKAVLKEVFTTRAEADTWLAQHLKTITPRAA